MPCVGEDRKFTPDLYIHSFFLAFLLLHLDITVTVDWE